MDLRVGGKGYLKVQRPVENRIDPTVFYVSLLVVLAFVAWGVLFTDNISAVTGAILTYLMTNFGWVFILSTLGFLIFMLYLAFSRYGSIRLGRDDERPEFRTVSWIAMMFSAGMGIGLMFFGVAEPMTYLGAPPHGLAEANTKEAAETAMQFTYFHWAFHPWAIYAVVALTIAYFTFRKGAPNLVSSAFRPILGDRVERWPGKTLDILAIFATLFGSCTSLGLGALQMNSGLNFIWGVPQTTTVAIIIIAIVTALFVVSAVSGVERGIQWLSNGNMVLAVLLLLFVLFMGPTLYIANTFVSSIGNYLFNLVPMSFTTAANGDEAFLSSWTIFYWVWWASWGPFVGTFIARISRGRTIREFAFGVLLVPSLVSFLWFAVFGGAAMNLDLFGGANIAQAVADSPEAALFSTLAQFPLASVTSFIAILLVGIFFISGADAASVVMGMLSSRGTLNPKGTIVALWGALTGAAAAVALLFGGLEGLQTVAIIAGAPFALVMIGMVYSLFKSLREEGMPSAGPYPGAPEPGRAISRPSGVPTPQQMSAEDRR
ncbi:MAG: Glycine betaine transporter OpuD [uncultured Rubrobacteraceae bacterium]|uniref:Glycine betaine transporter OpuD n=1 Tax=uncultured Rubrobacteraceae bacterium TaxID=349277 RepID=A0A6J4R9W9_9ACTN|nr:MAG: Glycine betaine transporter OpuD [uncultured Rubrobacteraceae bacterium]